MTKKSNKIIEKLNPKELKEEDLVIDPLQEMTELAKRTQANFENYRKQTEKRIEDIKHMASRSMILSLLPIVDNFALALKSPDCNKEFIKGIELIYSQLDTILEDNDVKSIKSENKPFDPRFHEAIMKVESELPENTVVEEFQRGFTLHGQVIRHAKVKISSGKKEKNRT